MSSSLILLHPPTLLLRHTLPHRLTILRHGGGPRTFPGGLNKWQWKRLHEKQAREKEKRLLNQEKQIYQARVRSEIRSNLSEPKQDLNLNNYKPVSPKQHVKVLADRFMKEGAEDLWNENDGPVKSVSKVDITRVESYHEPVDLKRVVSSNRISSGRGFSKMTVRHYSSVRNVELTRVESYHEPIDLKRVVSSNWVPSDLGFSKMTARHYSVGTSKFSYRTEMSPRPRRGLSLFEDVCLGFSEMTLGARKVWEIEVQLFDMRNVSGVMYTLMLLLALD